MRRAARVVLLAGMAALLLGAGAAGWTLWTLPRDALVADAERRLAEVGLSVVAEGAPELVLWPLPGVRLGPLRPGPGEAPARLAARTVVIGVAPRAILAGAASGRIRLSGATLELSDPRLPQAIVLSEAELTLAPRAGSGLSLAGEAGLAGRRVAIAAEIADVAALAAGDASAVTLELSATGDRLRFSGTAAVDAAGAVPAVAGTISVESADPLASARWLAEAVGVPPAPAAAGRCPPGRLLPPDAGADGRGCALALEDLAADATLDGASGRLLARGRGSVAAAGRTVGFDGTLRAGEGWTDGAVSAELALRVGGVLSAHWHPEAAVTDGAWQAAGPLDAAILDMASLRNWSGVAFAGWPDAGATSLSAWLEVSGRGAALSEAEARPDATPLPSLALAAGRDAPAGPTAVDAATAGGAAHASGAGGAAATQPQTGRDRSSEGPPEWPRGETRDAPAGPEAGIPGRAGSGAGDAAATPGRAAAADAAAFQAAGDDPGDEGDPVAGRPDTTGSAATGDLPPPEDLRGAPLPPGTPPPAPGRRDPLSAPAPAPRAGPPLAPTVTAP